MGDIEFLSSGANEEPDEFRDESSNTEDSRVSEISLLESSTIMPSILVEEKNDRSKVAEQITEMRETLKQAINACERAGGGHCGCALAVYSNFACACGPCQFLTQAG